MFTQVLSVPLSQLWLVIVEPSAEASFPTKMLVQPSPWISPMLETWAIGGAKGLPSAGAICDSKGQPTEMQRANTFSKLILSSKTQIRCKITV
jgi:hypothetical protein